jgi:glycosyltransferase involved in cell wall biosynthesis
VYQDKRAQYLIEKLKDKINLIDVLHVDIDRREPYFWINLFLCAIEVFLAGLRKGQVKINRRVLNNNYFRRPSFIKKISSKVEEYVNSMIIKPDFILQWSAAFAQYIGSKKIPFALIIDSYADPALARTLGRLSIYHERFYQFQKELFYNATYIFTLSKWCKEGLSKEHTIHPKKIIATGWGPAQKIETNKSTEKKDYKSILAVGNDFKAKGFDILVKCAKYLKDFSITIVSEDYNSLKDVPENVHLKGYVSEELLISLYLKSELFFIFSKFEAAGHVLWEAQAYGCVIIGYDAFGISEAVINSKTGVLLKTRNPILVAEEIRKLYQDRTILKRMRKTAVDNYRKNGTWEHASKEIAKRLILQTIPQKFNECVS